jgi:hypothetical protein
MRPRQLLQLMDSIKLGSDVAEHEQELSDLFVTDNEAYRRLISDEVDLISGGKGAGKSAIYRMITETRVSDDLDVIRASNPTAAPEFRALFQGNDSEERLRSIWAVYIASKIGNYVVDNLGNSPMTVNAVLEICDLLELMGLREAPQQKESLLARIRRSKSVEGSITGGAPGLELGLALKFELPTESPSDRAESAVLSYPDFFSMLQLCGDVLKAEGRRVWLAFDRLDECFMHDSPMERRALRALLRTHLDASEALHHTSWIRLKIFLRADMLSRMTSDGAFTNATHLRRAEIAWSFNAMRDLIARRLIHNTKFVEAFLADSPVAEWPELAWETLLSEPSKPRRQGGAPEPLAHRLTRDTADGSRLFNPRNLITLLNLSLDRARQSQRRDIQLDRVDREPVPIIRESELHSALGELSRRRFQDTVLNEFPAVQPLADRLRGGSAMYASASELQLALGMTDADASAAIDVLTLSGLLSPSNGQFVVPRLYRPALNAKMPKAPSSPTSRPRGQ